MKAVRVKDAASVRDLGAFHIDFHMLDANVPGMVGGTGETFSWDLAKAHLGEVPLVLSGGMTTDNAGEAVRLVRPFAVDSASGTEAQLGRKDPAKVAALFAAVEAADTELATA